MRKKTILAALWLSLLMVSLTVSLQPLVIQAQVASDSAETETNPLDEETTQSLKERVQKAVEKQKEAIKGAIDQLGREKRGFIGEVQRVSEETLTIRTSKGIEIIAIEAGVQLLRNNSATDVENVAVGDWAIVMGFQENETFEPRRILLSAETLRPRDYQLQIGSIQSVERTSLTLLPRSSEESVALTLSTTTSYQDLNGDAATLADVSEDLQALVIWYEDEDGDKVVTVVRMLTQLDNES